MDLHHKPGHLIRRLHQNSTHVFTLHMQQTGIDLTPVQYAAMDAIARAPGIDQASVAAEIGYDRATIGGVIDRLEQKGYINRTVSKRDRRAREVSLTEEGSRVFDQISPVVEALQAEILPGLSAQEQALFVELANKAVSGFKE
ncbi:MAG: MarR family transcriptional regulator [Oceanospirillaceae bacterium]|uniref:MarR family winged helix-turn-helix transcriptional regulator n=1 Tax=Marinobacterium litorale TaxID=404770 RepID=UPI0004835353|nr:MarR family transcriptional regulator [Marinobacterium litorale]MBS98040.1 MarR family transcriptional regulator [Oceanospirillaceae bacterium]